MGGWSLHVTSGGLPLEVLVSVMSAPASKKPVWISPMTSGRVIARILLLSFILWVATCAPGLRRRCTAHAAHEPPPHGQAQHAGQIELMFKYCGPCANVSMHLSMHHSATICLDNAQLPAEASPTGSDCHDTHEVANCNRLEAHVL